MGVINSNAFVSFDVIIADQSAQIEFLTTDSSIEDFLHVYLETDRISFRAEEELIEFEAPGNASTDNLLIYSSSEGGKILQNSTIITTANLLEIDHNGIISGAVAGQTINVFNVDADGITIDDNAANAVIYRGGLIEFSNITVGAGGVGLSTLEGLNIQLPTIIANYAIASGLNITEANPVAGNNAQVEIINQAGNLIKLSGNDADAGRDWMHFIPDAVTIDATVINRFIYLQTANLTIDDIAPVNPQIIGLDFDFTGMTETNVANTTLYGLRVAVPATLAGYSAGAALYTTDGTYIVQTSTGALALSTTDGVRTAQLSNGVDAINYSGNAVGDTLDLTPAGNVDAIDITGTNITTAAAIDADFSAKISGNVIDFLLDTVTIQANSDIITITESRHHDDMGADAYNGYNIAMSSNWGGTNASVASLLNAVYTGIIGGVGVNADLFGLNLDFSAYTHTNGDVRGINIDFTGSVCAAGTQYGLYVDMPAAYGAGTDVAGYFGGDGRSVTICDDTIALTIVGGMALDTLDLTPTTNEDALDIILTNATWTSASGIHIDVGGWIGGSNIVNIAATVAGTIATNASMISIDGGTNITFSDAGAGTQLYSGMRVDMSAITAAHANFLGLSGIAITMPAAAHACYGGNKTSAIYATGNGNIFSALRGDGVYLLMTEAGSIATNLVSDAEDLNNAMQSIYVSKDMNITVAAAGGATLINSGNTFDINIDTYSLDTTPAVNPHNTTAVGLRMYQRHRQGAASDVGNIDEVFSGASLDLDQVLTINNTNIGTPTITTTAPFIDMDLTITETAGAINIGTVDWISLTITGGTIATTDTIRGNVIDFSGITLNDGGATNPTIIGNYIDLGLIETAVTGSTLIGQAILTSSNRENYAMHAGLLISDALIGVGEVGILLDTYLGTTFYHQYLTGNDINADRDWIGIIPAEATFTATATVNFIHIDTDNWTITDGATSPIIRGGFIDFTGITETDVDGTEMYGIEIDMTTSVLYSSAAAIQVNKGTNTLEIMTADEAANRMLQLTVGTSTQAIWIDADTTDIVADGNIFTIDAGIAVNVSANLINLSMDFSGAMGGADSCNGIYFDMNELVAHTNNSAIRGASFIMTGFATGAADLIGHTINFDGEKNQGDLCVGFNLTGDITLNNAGEEFYGYRADLSGIVETLSDRLIAFEATVPDGRHPAFDTNIRGTVSGRIEYGAYEFIDHFAGRSSNPVWTTRVTTGAVGGAPASGDLGGVYDMLTGGVISNEESLDWNDIFEFDNTLRPTFEIRVYLESIDATDNFAFGLVNTNIGNGQAGLALDQGGAGNQDFVIIEYSNTTHGDALWHLSCQLDGVSTVGNGAAAAATTWVILRFEFVSDTSVEWFIDGVSQGTVSTNVPTDALQPILFVLTDAGATLYADIDYVKIWQDRV